MGEREAGSSPTGPQGLYSPWHRDAAVQRGSLVFDLGYLGVGRLHCMALRCQPGHLLERNFEEHNFKASRHGSEAVVATP